MRSFGARLRAHNILYLMLLLGMSLPPSPARAQRITPKRMILLSANMDSLVRSYSKKGFTLVPAERDAGAIFRDRICLPDGFEMELRSPFGLRAASWQRRALTRFGAHVAGFVFETEDPDSLFRLCRANGIPCSVVRRSADSASRIEAFALDSCHPLDVLFMLPHHEHVPDSLARHRNSVYRLDWVLLSAGVRMQSIVRQVFALSDTWAMHTGPYDFWRTGSPDDFTFFRFEPVPKTAANDPYWLSIEPDNFYWAYP